MIAEPVLTAVTLPEPSTEATPALEVAHVPPVLASVKRIVVPIHIAEGPLIALTEGIALMVMAAVAEAEQPPELTV